MAEAVSNVRRIVERWIIQGELELLTPVHLGNGEGDGDVDLPVYLDAGGLPLLAGSNLAGALRNYLRLYEFGYFPGEESDERVDTLHRILFGGTQAEENGHQSLLIVDDAFSEEAALSLTIRDCVMLSEDTNTAEDQGKFDFEVLEPGTHFNLRFELLLTDDANKDQLQQALNLSLRGLELGEVQIGAKKTRGFGRCSAKSWTIWKFNLQDREDLLKYLKFNRPGWEAQQLRGETGTASELFSGVETPSGDQREYVHFRAQFALPESILIRSNSPSLPSDAEAKELLNAPDAVHLKSRRNDRWQDTLSGTSLAGALRHRARKILRTVWNSEDVDAWVEEMFGPQLGSKEKDPAASPFVVEETSIQDAVPLVHTRNRIDPFTGGTLSTALFTEQPAFGSDSTRVGIEFCLRLGGRREKDSPLSREARIGLLLLCLKDLWMGDLWIGGESAVGRGRLLGCQGALCFKRVGQSAERIFLEVQERDGRRRLEIPETSRNLLQGYVDALLKLTNSRKQETQRKET